MAFDGVTIAGIVKELNDSLTGGRVYKIAQPESDELMLTIKVNGGQKRLFISASASLPLIYLTENNKQSPLTAPGFCMLLRKHIQNGRIVRISQPGLERIVRIQVEHLNEMGDLCSKNLIIEIMGKHSNIIFTDDKDRIIDSIKHISSMVSSVREVLPGRSYFIPETQKKKDALNTDKEEFFQAIRSGGQPVYKLLYGSYTGLSPVFAQELCFRAGLDGDASAASLSESDAQKLYDVFQNAVTHIQIGDFTPNIVYEHGSPVEFSVLPLTMYQDEERKNETSVSSMLERYYAQRNSISRIRQKSADLRRIVQTALERNVKKYDLQLRQIKDTEKREKYRVYGELLNTYGYQASPGDKSITARNYYTDEDIEIPLDPTITPLENAKKYFEKYNKMKRTYEALSTLTLEVKEEIEHLESISASLDIAAAEEDLVQIREELVQSGYIRRKGGDKKIKITSRPFHYISSDGYHIYVGKNNFQNDELTFRFASGNDWWFHAKGIPGSHVIVKTKGEPLPDRTFEEAAKLAAYYSRARGQEKAEIDYTEKKNIKKPNGGKPGFVIYHTNYSMVMDSDISRLCQIQEP
mgnify:FL=1